MVKIKMMDFTPSSCFNKEVLARFQKDSFSSFSQYFCSQKVAKFEKSNSDLLKTTLGLAQNFL